MKAMILAAGRGQRMRPLTDTLPKPLLSVGGKSLIVYHIEKLAIAGITDIVINTSYLGDKIQQALGSGAQWGVTIRYSQEQEPLETAGALLHALPLLEDKPFLLVNGDVWTDFVFDNLLQQPLTRVLGRLVLVHNPEHNPEGDFSLSDKLVTEKHISQPTYTFAGIGLFNPAIVRDYPRRRQAFPLREVFHEAIQNRQLEAILHQGQWWDVGTPERIRLLDQWLKP